MGISAIRNSIFEALSQKFFYGWTMLFVAGLGIFTSGAGQSHTFAVFFLPIQEDLGVSSGEVASAYAFATLIASFGLPFMGRLVDKHGPRRMTLVVVGLLGLACFFFGAAANLLWLGLGFMGLRFLGQGSLMLNSSNMVAKWFDRKRGFALGLMALGFAVSMAVHPFIGQLLIENFGWRNAWFALGLVTWLTMLPPVLMLVHNTPEAVGLRPDGEAPAEGAATNSAANKGLTLGEALRTPSFHIVWIGMFSISMLVTVCHLFQVAIFASHQLSAYIATAAFAVSAVTMVACMPLVGRILDRFPTRYVFAAGMLITATSLVAATLVRDLPTAVVYAFIFGANNAFSMTLFGYMWPRYFGRLHLGSVQGAGQMIGVVGASAGAPAVGFAHDLMGGFEVPLQMMAIYPAVWAVVVIFTLRTPRQLDENHPLD